MTPTASPRRHARLTAGGIALGTTLVLAAPLAASAHVHVTPEESVAGASSRLTFSFSHGCEGAATTALVFTVPDGVDGITPVYEGGWSVERELGDDGIATQVAFTPATPIDDGLSASVSMDVIFSSAASGTEVAFPVLQKCGDSQHDWAQVAEEGQDAHDLDSPAPVVAVGEAAETAEHGHGDDAPAPAAVGDGSDPVARWLSGGALVAAVAALLVAFVRRRRA